MKWLAWTAEAAAPSPSATPKAVDSLGLSSLSSSIDEVPRYDSGSMTGSLIWVFISLALIIGLITLLIRWLSRRSQIIGGGRALEQLGGLTLGPNKSIQVIEAAGRIYVVGVGENVTLLDSLPAGEEAKELREQLLQKRHAAAGIPAAEWLRRLQGKRAAGGNEASDQAEETKDDARRFQQLLHQKLEQQSKQQEDLERLLQETSDRDRLREK